MNSYYVTFAAIDVIVLKAVKVMSIGDKSIKKLNVRPFTGLKFFLQ